MAYAMLGWNNRIMGASLFASSAAAGLPVTNLQNDQGTPAMGWQTTSVTGQYVSIDSGSNSNTWRAFGLFRTNLTTAATVRIRVGNDNTFATWNYDSGTVSAGVSVGFGQAVVTAAADQTGRYCLIEPADSGNPDGFINIPLAYAGPVWIPATNVSFGSSLGRDDQTDEVTTRGGQEFPVLQFVRRRWDVEMEGVRASELWPQAMDLDRFARTGGNALFVPNPSGDVARETIFGRGKSLADILFPYGNADRRSWKIRFTERL